MRMENIRQTRKEMNGIKREELTKAGPGFVGESRNLLRGY